jgi:hypothetical protein
VMSNLSLYGLKRWGRRLLWPRPVLYLPLGLLRGHGNILRARYQLYISGFPRSGNTFALKAFQQANPGVPVRSHKHIPVFVVQSLKWNMPGIVLIRNPIDAAISWSIFTKQPVWESLAYYNDYYSVLLPHREALQFVSFEEVVGDFGKVIEALNTRWETNYTPFQHTPDNVGRCMREIESDFFDPVEKRVNESVIPRPSIHRKSQRESYLPQLNQSRARTELQQANELYHALAPRVFVPKKPEHRTSTQNIRLRPAM